MSLARAPAWRTLVLTALAMLAFAANSLLTRLALAPPSSIDPASFGSVRLASGAVALAAIVYWRHRRASTLTQGGDWWSAAMLWLYVAAFSFAYLTLSAGSGALILFGCVQLTMFAVGWRRGERFAAVAWVGFALAAGGLVWLLAPGLSAPPLAGALLMATAGVAWGVYSLRGRGTLDPLAATAGNFLRATPLALALSLAFAASFEADARGLVLAIASGALTSGLGYVVWYAALPRLGAMRAATVQLSVPPLAAAGGVWWLGEALTPRLLLASAAVLGGIALVLGSRHRGMARPPASTGR